MSIRIQRIEFERTPELDKALAELLAPIQDMKKQRDAMTKQEKIALHHFYKALGSDLGDKVIPSIDGLTFDGFITTEEYRLIGEAYEGYLEIMGRGEC